MTRLSLTQSVWFCIANNFEPIIGIYRYCYCLVCGWFPSQQHLAGCSQLSGRHAGRTVSRSDGRPVSGLCILLLSPSLRESWDYGIGFLCLQDPAKAEADSNCVSWYFHTPYILGCSFSLQLHVKQSNQHIHIRLSHVLFYHIYCTSLL